MKMLQDFEIDFSKLSKEKAERIKLMLKLRDEPENLLRAYRRLLKDKTDEEIKKILREHIKFTYFERNWRAKTPG